MLDWLVSKLIILPGIIVGLSVHEYGHARVAMLCGDDTAWRQGRVSLNPLDHINWLGFVMLFLIGFGWGRPVQVNVAKLKKPRRDLILVDLAGVFMNLITAIIFAFILRFVYQLFPEFFFVSKVGSITRTVIIQTIIINLSLMLFNLIPIPPLDGFGVISGIIDLPRRNYQLYRSVIRYGYPVLLIFILLDGPSKILNVPLNNIYNAIMNLAFIGL